VAADRQRRVPTTAPGIDLRLRRLQELRYGENPHQSAALYGVAGVALADGPVQRRCDAAAGQAAQLQQHPRRVGGGGAGARPARAGLRHRQARQPVRRGRGG
jgi:hypothetical protein